MVIKCSPLTKKKKTTHASINRLKSVHILKENHRKEIDNSPNNLEKEKDKAVTPQVSKITCLGRQIKSLKRLHVIFA